MYIAQHGDQQEYMKTHTQTNLGNKLYFQFSLLKIYLFLNT